MGTQMRSGRVSCSRVSPRVRAMCGVDHFVYKYQGEGDVTLLSSAKQVCCVSNEITGSR